MPVGGIFNVVLDVGRYQEFLPLCTFSEVDKSSIVIKNDSEGEFKARLSMGVSSLVTFSYTSAVTYKKYQTIISESVDEEAFKRLHSRWDFRPLTKSRSVIQYRV